MIWGFNPGLPCLCRDILPGCMQGMVDFSFRDGELFFAKAAIIARITFADILL